MALNYNLAGWFIKNINSI